MARTTVDVVLSVVDRITAPINAIQRRIDRLTAPVRRVAKVIGDMGRAAGIDKLASRFSHLGSSVANVGRHVSTLALGFGGLFALGAGAGLSQFISVNSEFEKFGTVLETVLGSADKAQSSLAWISEFAAKTPYDLAGVTEAFVKLTSYGIKPIDGALLSAGNAAAAMGKPLNQAVEALADAMTGENERLKEFGITTEKIGDRIKYNWVENGKQMTAFAQKNSRKQIEAVITGIWNRQYSGAMDKLSKTWEGMTSNLGDQWTRFMLKIGDAGAFKNLEGILEDVLKWFDRMSASGNLDVWAKSISDSISGVADEFRKFLLGYDVVGDSLKDSFHVPGFLDEFPRHLKNFTTTLGDLATGLKDFYATIKPAIDFVGGPGNAALIAMGAITFGPLLASLASLGVAFAGLLLAVSAPVWAVLGVLALLGGAVYVLYQKWDEFAAYWSNLWTRVSNAFNVSWTSGVLAVLQEFNPLKHVMVGMNALIEYFTGIDLLAAGDRIIGSFIDGLAQGLRDGIASLTAEMPDWLKSSLGIEVKAPVVANYNESLLGAAGVAPSQYGADGKLIEPAQPQRVSLPPVPDAPAFDQSQMFIDKLQMALPPAPQLEIVMPDVSPAQVAAPGSDSAATVRVPEIKVPEIVVPKPEAPSLGPIEVKAPEIKVPEIVVPKPEAPSLGPIEVKAPEIKVPEIVVPEIKIPPIAVPAVAPPPTPSSYSSSLLGSQGVPMSGLPQSGNGPVQTSQIDAVSVSVGTATFPEPIVANQPQTVHAPFNVGGVSITGTGLSAVEVQAAINAAMSGAAARHAAEIRSALND
ncbi:tape measure protein [Aureimonas glaciei]|uniref:Tape measure protein N-terminal domain-containing protein n=1 Tax=Aureimonas glaciei TaxID=1776957 RepID=A0A916YEU4_9HYPH|nr:tape measure protein [Aureimonas glaciei]GGD41853.1 hypothetical protein GCM10011335_50690 [Aureimonas glaciei]